MATAQNKKLATAVSATITGPVLVLRFSNDRVLEIDANALSPDIQHAAMMHGLKQKLIDAAAIARDPDTGGTATIDSKYNAVREVFDRITAADNPTWNKVRSSGESGGNKGGMLVRAMMRLTSKSRDAILEFLDAKSKEELAALRKNPRIAEIIAQLQVEQANTNGVDSDALLDALMDGSDIENGGDADADADADLAESDSDGDAEEPAAAPAPEAATEGAMAIRAAISKRKPATGRAKA